MILAGNLSLIALFMRLEPLTTSLLVAFSTTVPPYLLALSNRVISNEKSTRNSMEKYVRSTLNSTQNYERSTKIFRSYKNSRHRVLFVRLQTLIKSLLGAFLTTGPPYLLALKNHFLYKICEIKAKFNVILCTINAKLNARFCKINAKFNAKLAEI